jgi:hypothetical protein
MRYNPTVLLAPFLDGDVMCDRCKNTVVSNVQIGWGKQSCSYNVALIKLHVPGILTPVALRPATTDIPTFAQIFVTEQYQSEKLRSWSSPIADRLKTVIGVC